MTESNDNYIRRFHDLYMNRLEDECGLIARELRQGRLSEESLKELHAFGDSRGPEGHNAALLFIVKHLPENSPLFAENMRRLLGNIDIIMTLRNPNSFALVGAFLSYLDKGSEAHRQIAAHTQAWRTAKDDLAKFDLPDGPG